MRYLITAGLLLTSWTVVFGQQETTVDVRLKNGDSIVTTLWFFDYGCVTSLRDNPGLGVRRSWQNRDLRLVVDGRERLIPARLLASVHFDWATPRPGWLTRSRARFSLTTGETIEHWDLRSEDCGLASVDLTLVLPPQGERRDWVRVDLWTTQGGEAAAFDLKDRVVEVRFGTR